MKLSDFYDKLNEVAPKNLSDLYCEKFGAYDNSGVLIDTGKEVKKALFSLDFSLSAIKKAKEEGVDVIVTHHPAIYGSISDIRFDTPLGKKLCICLQSGISVLSMHLNLDCVQGGIDESFEEAICGEEGGKNLVFMHKIDEKNGYGRCYALPQKTTLLALKEGLQKKLNAKNISVFGEDKPVYKVASFCGAGTDEGALSFAKKEGADVIISADFKHHIIVGALESGLCVLALTHYASEWYGFQKFYKKMSRAVEIPCILHGDDQLL